ncbi:D-alanyl-D-alanine dipeptidase [Sphaerisporangium rufum]|uniref:D-alanyl-D-alanine dipeptidase n=1 Tax=Sphaerisporangium rufum TaxID=1381558 RepID=A0A919QXF0_9ACTN|nr:M15 family metallopeptidase [Sphaerisporangium rufum]GII75737.1 D-alanyl-D-alanine dipeptidase [Sphaerisporangium rufum]
MPKIVLLSDPRIAQVPVRECGEPLVNLRTLEALRVDTRLADAEGLFAHVRLSVADRLMAAQTRLPRALRLLIVEGFRPAALQERYFAESVATHRQANPEWDDRRAAREASKYISPPEVAPHVTGGAVDLTLCTVSGVELPMGTQVNATPPESDEACHTGFPGISAEARRNRDTLGAALSAAGFVNYPTEWWHWSHGDRYWAFTTGAATACYGMSDGPPPAYGMSDGPTPEPPASGIPF